MHPEFTSQIVSQRIAELHRQADHQRQLRELRSNHSGGRRRVLGWFKRSAHAPAAYGSAA